MHFDGSLRGFVEDFGEFETHWWVLEDPRWDLRGPG